MVLRRSELGSDYVGFAFWRLARMSYTGLLSAKTRHSAIFWSRITAFQAAGVHHGWPSMVPPASPAANTMSD